MPSKRITFNEMNRQALLELVRVKRKGLNFTQVHTLSNQYLYKLLFTNNRRKIKKYGTKASVLGFAAYYLEQRE